MRPTNPYSFTPKPAAGAPPGRPAPASGDGALKPDWRALLDEFRALGQANQRIVRGVTRSLQSADANLAAVCRRAVAAAPNLSDSDLRDLVRAARAEKLVERGATDGIRVLVRIGCGRKTSGSVVSRATALCRMAMEKKLDLDAQLQSGFWAAYNRLLPTRRPRVAEDGQVQLRITIPASAARKLGEGDTVLVQLARDAVRGTVRAQVTAGAVPAAGIGDAARLALTLTSDLFSGCSEGRAEPMKPTHEDEEPIAVTESRTSTDDAAVALGLGGQIASAEATVPGRSVFVLFGRLVKGTTDEPLLEAAGGKFVSVLLNRQRRKVWRGAITPEVEGVMQRQEGRVVVPDDVPA